MWHYKRETKLLLFFFSFQQEMISQLFLFFGRFCHSWQEILIFTLFSLGNDLNTNAEVKWLVDLTLLPAVINGADLQVKEGRFLEAASEMKTPHPALGHDLELLSFVTFDYLILDVLLLFKVFKLHSIIIFKNSWNTFMLRRAGWSRIIFVRCLVWSSLTRMDNGWLVFSSWAKLSNVKFWADPMLRFPLGPTPLTLHEKHPSVEMILSLDWL